MEITHFEDIQAEFMARAQQAVYCNVVTVDRKGRPRSRVMHLIWEGPVGWVIYFGLLRFAPWRIELAELGKESLIWRPGTH